MPSKRKNAQIGGLLTERQVQVLSLRNGSLTQEEVAVRLGISRQDVSVLERRALRNIEKAADTLQMAENLGLVRSIRIGAGKHILDVAKAIMEFADSEGIRIRASAIGVMTLIQAASGPSVENGVVKSGIEATIMVDGRVSVKPL